MYLHCSHIKNSYGPWSQETDRLQPQDKYVACVGCIQAAAPVPVFGRYEVLPVVKYTWYHMIYLPNLPITLRADLSRAQDNAAAATMILLPLVRRLHMF